MDQSRVRFTIRTLMNVVAASACLSAAAAKAESIRRTATDRSEMARQAMVRCQGCNARMAACGARIARLRAAADSGTPAPRLATSIAREVADLERWRAARDHYFRLKRKYDEAARSPWRSVEPDPPPPDADRGPGRSGPADRPI